MEKENAARIAVVMAGGAGERFWPLSRKKKPKQLLCLSSPHKTLLEKIIETLDPVFGMDSILFATGRGLVSPIISLGTGIPEKNVIPEPAKKNTAGCLAYISAVLLARDIGDPILAVLPADHLYKNQDMFREIVEDALSIAGEQNVLVTLGVRPARPETGYGYIEIRDTAEAIRTKHGYNVSQLSAFREKPDITTAEKYIKTGRHFWNSGIFFWKLSVFMEEMKKASPEIAASIYEMAGKMRVGDQMGVEDIFSRLPDISIDYALMEKAQNVMMIEADFGWDDIGAWDAMDRTFPQDPNGNVTVGDPVLIDTKNCIVYNEPGSKSVAVSIIGVEGLVVVVSGDGVLVVPKNRAQDVKKAVEELREKGAAQL